MRRIWLGLCLGAVAVVVAGPVARYVDYRHARGVDDEPAEWARYLDLGTEGNLPTFYSASLLVALAAACAVRAVLVGRRLVPAWVSIGVVAALLALDEATALHERFLDPLGRRLGGGEGFLRFAWVVPGSLLALGGSLFLLTAARRLPAPTRRSLGLALAMFLAGALAVEAISGAVLEERGHDRVYLGAMTLEEGLEFAGILIALRCVLGGLDVRRDGAALVVTAPPQFDGATPRHALGIAGGKDGVLIVEPAEASPA